MLQFILQSCKYVESKIVRKVSDEEGSPGFRSSSGDEGSRASQKRKKLRKKKERKAPGKKEVKSPEKVSPEKTEAEKKVRKSPEKSLEKMRQRLQKQMSSKDLVERKGSVGEERRPSIIRRQSVTNYDLADVLRKDFKPFKIILKSVDISLCL